MKREIRFRALKDDMSNCSFVFGQLVYDAAGFPRITETDKSGQGLLFHTCLTGTEGQFTGLKDISGKDIYEGDILSVSDIYERGDGSFDDGVLVVSFEDGMFLATDNSHYTEFLHISICKIIGNIHQNEELLK